MQSIIWQLEAINLHAKSHRVNLGVVSFNLWGDDVVEVAYACTAWDLRHPLLFQVRPQVRHWVGGETWQIAQERLEDIILASGARMFFVYGAQSAFILNSILKQPSAKNIKGEVIDLSRIGCPPLESLYVFRPPNCDDCAARSWFVPTRQATGFCAGHKATAMVQWVKNNVLRTC